MGNGWIPDRVRRAVDALSVHPSEHLLEIGCGNGGAVALICPRLDDGAIVAIDRDSMMIELARERNAAHVGAAKAVIRRMNMNALPTTDTFDRVFAVNVHTFWRRPVGPELEILKKVLRPNGSLNLFYESPAPRAQELARRVVAALDDWHTTTTHLDGRVMLIQAHPR